MIIGRDGRLSRDNVGIPVTSRKPGLKATGHSKPRDSLDRDKNLRDSPVTKITGQSGLGQIFAGLSRMIVPRDLWDREKKMAGLSRPVPWPSLLLVGIKLH